MLEFSKGKNHKCKGKYCDSVMEMEHEAREKETPDDSFSIMTSSV